MVWTTLWVAESWVRWAGAIHFFSWYSWSQRCAGHPDTGFRPVQSQTLQVKPFFERGESSLTERWLCERMSRGALHWRQLTNPKTPLEDFVSRHMLASAYLTWWEISKEGEMEIKRWWQERREEEKHYLSSTCVPASCQNRNLVSSGMRHLLLEIDIVMSSSLFMLITYYSVMTGTNERDWHSLDIFLLYLLE